MCGSCGPEALGSGFSANVPQNFDMRNALILERCRRMVEGQCKNPFNAFVQTLSDRSERQETCVQEQISSPRKAEYALISKAHDGVFEKH